MGYTQNDLPILLMLAAVAVSCLLFWHWDRLGALDARPRFRTGLYLLLAPAVALGLGFGGWAWAALLVLLAWGAYCQWRRRRQLLAAARVPAAGPPLRRDVLIDD